MRAYIVNEQNSMADLLGVQAGPQAGTGGCRNSDPVADTEGARQVGCRFTSEEWYSIWFHATEQRQGRRTEEQLTREFRRFYNKFGPSSYYRMPQAYASALLNERVNIGATNPNWAAIRNNLQRILRQAQSAEAQRGSDAETPDATLEAIARSLEVATRGLNWNEGDILYAVRQLRSQRDWDIVSEMYPTLRTSRQSLASVLNELNRDEKATIRRHFNSVDIDPGDEFEYTSESSLPAPIRQIPDLVPGDKNEQLDEDEARAYASSVLGSFVDLLNEQNAGLGDRFDDFITNEQSPEGTDFRRDITEFLRLDGVNRLMIDNRIMSNTRLIWEVFSQWQSQADE